MSDLIERLRARVPHEKTIPSMGHNAADRERAELIALLTEAAAALRQAAVPAGEAVAYLDIGVGGYLDLGTEKDDDELFKLPPGRHMLGIIGTHGVDGYKAPQPAGGEAVAWRHPDEVPKVVPGGNAYFWVAVRRKHDGRVYSFPAQYLNAMLLCNEWSDDTERSGNRYHHGPTCEVEGSFPATGWHDAKEHGEYDCVYQPLLGDADELVAWREVADYPATTPQAAQVQQEADRG